MSGRLGFGQIIERIAESCALDREKLEQSGIPKCVQAIASQIADDPRYQAVGELTLPADSTSVPLSDIQLPPILDLGDVPVQAQLSYITQFCLVDSDAPDPCILEDGLERTRLRCRRDPAGPPVGFEVIGDDLHVYPKTDQEYKLQVFACREVDCTVKQVDSDGVPTYLFPDLPPEFHAALACCIQAEVEFENRNYADATNLQASAFNAVNLILEGRQSKREAQSRVNDSKVGKCFKLGYECGCGGCGGCGDCDGHVTMVDVPPDPPAKRVFV